MDQHLTIEGRDYRISDYLAEKLTEADINVVTIQADYDKVSSWYQGSKIRCTAHRNEPPSTVRLAQAHRSQYQDHYTVGVSYLQDLNAVREKLSKVAATQQIDCTSAHTPEFREEALAARNTIRTMLPWFRVAERRVERQQAEHRKVLASLDGVLGVP